jgi:hypothetical protein
MHLNKIELVNFLKIDNSGGRKSKEGFFKKNLPDLAIIINHHNELYFNNHNFIWKQKIYNYINNLTKIPKCKNIECNNNCNYSKLENKYYSYCSKKCSTSSIESKNKIKETCLNKYGVTNPMKNTNIREKVRKTIKEKINDDSNYYSNICQKRKRTWIKIYGVDNPNKNKKIVEKKKNTCIKKYNMVSNLCTDENKRKVKETCLIKYSVDNPMKSNKIKEKLDESCQKKYGKKRFILTTEHINNNSKNNKQKAILIFSKLLNVDINNLRIEDNILTIKNYCNKHNEFKITKNNVYNRINQKIENICTLCNPISEQSSIKENEILDFISNKLNIRNIIKKDKTILKGKEIDTYLPDHKLGIEFNGIYYHSNKFKDKNYHLNKTNLCEQKDIRLLHIFEDEWINKKEIVKSIIKSKLGIFDNKILADNSTINEIDALTCDNFLNNNYIHDIIKSKIRIGLFYNDDLVLVMTFIKKKTNCEYELCEFCNKLNTQVVNGASKLLNYFIKTYNPKSILAFVNRRYSQGNQYKELGFKFIENTKPNCWYLKKHKLVKVWFDPNKIEFENMDDKKYLIVYDCGNIKFKLTINSNRLKL